MGRHWHTLHDVSGRLLATLFRRDAKLHQAHQLGADLGVAFVGAVHDKVLVLQYFLQFVSQVVRVDLIQYVFTVQKLGKGSGQVDVQWIPLAQHRQCLRHVGTYNRKSYAAGHVVRKRSDHGVGALDDKVVAI